MNISGQSSIFVTDGDFLFFPGQTNWPFPAWPALDVTWDKLGPPVNGLTVVAGSTGSAVALEVAGTDPDVNIDLRPQGTGQVTVNGNPITIGFPLSSPGSMEFEPSGISNVAFAIFNEFAATNGFDVNANPGGGYPASTVGLDTLHPGAIVVGLTEASSLVIVPATTVTGLVTANGGVTVGAGYGLIVPAGHGLDTAAAGALDIGAAKATSVVITPVTSIAGGLSSTRITKRVLATAGPGATPAIDTDNYDVAHFTALAAAITSMTTNLTGTPVDGDTMRISFTDNGTAMAITWGASFEASTVALPTTTVISTRLDVGFLWNTETSKWRCAAVA